TDFGVARLIGAAEADGAGEAAPDPHTATRTGTVVGTPGYIAPEILRHEAVDARADQFSFCVALYTALADEPPFEPLDQPRRAAETLGRLRAPRRRAGPRWLRQLVARGLAAEPTKRWPSMGALVAAVDRRLARRRRVLTVSAVAAASLAAAAVAPP